MKRQWNSRLTQNHVLFEVRVSQIKNKLVTTGEWWTSEHNQNNAFDLSYPKICCAIKKDGRPLKVEKGQRTYPQTSTLNASKIVQCLTVFEKFKNFALNLKRANTIRSFGSAHRLEVYIRCATIAAKPRDFPTLLAFVFFFKIRNFGRICGLCS